MVLVVCSAYISSLSHELTPLSSNGGQIDTVSGKGRKYYRLQLLLVVEQRCGVEISAANFLTNFCKSLSCFFLCLKKHVNKLFLAREGSRPRRYST